MSTNQRQPRAARRLHCTREVPAQRPRSPRPRTRICPRPRHAPRPGAAAPFRLHCPLPIRLGWRLAHAHAPQRGMRFKPEEKRKHNGNASGRQPCATDHEVICHMCFRLDIGSLPRVLRRARASSMVLLMVNWPCLLLPSAVVLQQHWPLSSLRACETLKCSALLPGLPSLAFDSLQLWLRGLTA